MFSYSYVRINSLKFSVDTDYKRCRTFFRRYNLPIVFIIVNNNGIYHGIDEESWSEVELDPVRRSVRSHTGLNCHI